MAAVSAPHAGSALTPPSSSHGAQTSWNYSSQMQTENHPPKDYSKPPLTSQNGHSLNHHSSRPELNKRADTFNSTRSAESGYLAPARVNALNRKDSSISETGSAPDSLIDLYGQGRSGMNSIDYGDRQNGDFDDEEHSRWIHRDKLARIESQELQAAGIILPRSRAASKSSRRDHSRENHNGYKEGKRLGPIPTQEEEAPEANGWDLRLPDEAAEDNDAWRDVSGGAKGVSRIPVLKTSPLPIPLQHLERDTPMRRKPADEEPLSYSKTRSRSQSQSKPEEVSPIPTKRAAENQTSPSKKAPRKNTLTGTRNASGPASKPKPKTTRDTASGTRPQNRSSDLGAGVNGTKRPEGDPPWLQGMFKPDPRLPPDQQLLPTVAKRLQQEQWEKEGKFGNAYDTSFRPLNDEELQMHEQKPLQVDIPKPEDSTEWPLKAPKSPASPRPGTAGGQGSYSTMPKITGTPQGMPPLPSPRPVMQVQEPEKEKGAGCCCAVM